MNTITPLESTLSLTRMNTLLLLGRTHSRTTKRGSKTLERDGGRGKSDSTPAKSACSRRWSRGSRTRGPTKNMRLCYEEHWSGQGTKPPRPAASAPLQLRWKMNIDSRSVSDALDSLSGEEVAERKAVISSTELATLGRELPSIVQTLRMTRPLSNASG